MNKLFFTVPVYNVEKYLDRCVNSLLRQSYGNFEVVLIDDGSKDSSGKMCDGYAQKHCGIKVIHQQNGGLSAARNSGIEYCLKNGAREDYIAFIDSDDFVAEKFGELLIEISQKYNAPIVQCQYEKGSNDYFAEPNQASADYSLSAVDALLGYDLKSHSTPKLYKLKLFEDLRFPVGVLNEDEFVTYKAVYKAGKMAFSNRKLFYYYQHPGSIMDTIAKKLKGNPHKNDWLMAYMERYLFFKEHNEPELMKRTFEKICADIILRYSEQMNLKKQDRDNSMLNGEYKRAYRYFYKQMIHRRGIPFKRKLMYKIFYMLPISSFIAGKFVSLRK